MIYCLHRRNNMKKINILNEATKEKLSIAIKPSLLRTIDQTLDGFRLMYVMKKNKDISSLVGSKNEAFFKSILNRSELIEMLLESIKDVKLFEVGEKEYSIDELCDFYEDVGRASLFDIDAYATLSFNKEESMSQVDSDLIERFRIDHDMEDQDLNDEIYKKFFEFNLISKRVFSRGFKCINKFYSDSNNLEESAMNSNKPDTAYIQFFHLDTIYDEKNYEDYVSMTDPINIFFKNCWGHPKSEFIRPVIDANIKVCEQYSKNAHPIMSELIDPNGNKLIIEDVPKDYSWIYSKEFSGILKEIISYIIDKNICFDKMKKLKLLRNFLFDEDHQVYFNLMEVYILGKYGIN